MIVYTQFTLYKRMILRSAETSVCSEASRDFQSQFHGKVTASQIYKIVQPWHNEFHGIDARGGGLNGDHAIGIDANVRGRHLENP